MGNLCVKREIKQINVPKNKSQLDHKLVNRVIVIVVKNMIMEKIEYLFELRRIYIFIMIFFKVL